MPHEDPIVIVVQVIASKNVKLSLNSSHGMVDPSLQHGAAAYPFILGGGEEIQVNLLIGDLHGRKQQCLISSWDSSLPSTFYWNVAYIL